MRIVIKSKETVPVIARTKFNEKVRERNMFLYHNMKIDDWKKFIEYIKKYKEV